MLLSVLTSCKLNSSVWGNTHHTVITRSALHAGHQLYWHSPLSSRCAWDVQEHYLGKLPEIVSDYYLQWQSWWADIYMYHAIVKYHMTMIRLQILSVLF